MNSYAGKQIPVLFFYSLVAMVFVVLGTTLQPSNWRGDAQLHTLMELASTLLALVVSTVALIRFYSKKQTLYLFVGIGFLGTAFLDGYHAVVTSTFFSAYLPSGLATLIPWSWNASRTFLALLLVVSLWAWRREQSSNSFGMISERLVYLFVGSLTLVSFLFFTLFPLPRAYYPEFFFGRPEEFVAGLLFLLALGGYLRKGVWRTDPFERWLVLSLVLGVVSQMVVMSRSYVLFDAMFDLAHLMKILSYQCVLTGLFVNTFHLFKKALESHQTIVNFSALFQQESTRRELAENKLVKSDSLLESQKVNTESSRIAAIKMLQEMEMARQDLLKSESHAQEQATRLKAIFDGTIEGVLTVDVDGNIESINPAAEQLFGYHLAEVNGKPIEMLIPADQQKWPDSDGNASQEKYKTNILSVLGGEAIGRHKDGSTMSLELALSEIHVNGQDLFTSFVRDITDRKEAERALQKTLESLSEQKQEADASRNATLAMMRNMEVAKEQIKKTKIAAQEQATRTRAIVDSATDAIITIDIQGAVESLNKAAESIFGYTANEMLGKNVKMLMPAPFFAEHDGYLKAYEQTGKQVIIGKGREVIGKRKDGSTFPLDLSVSEVQLEGQRLFTGILRDITDRKVVENELLGTMKLLEKQRNEAETARCTVLKMLKEMEVAEREVAAAGVIAREQAARTKAIVNSATDAIITTDSLGVVESLNAAAKRIFGYDVEEVVGENIRLLIPSPAAEERDVFSEAFYENESGVAGSGREVVGKRKDGSGFPLELAVSEVQLEGEVLLTGIIRDITDRKEAELQQTKLNQEIKEQSEQIATTNATLERSNEELKQFAYVASHDLQEPLRKVNSFCQILQEEYGEQLDDTARTYIRYAVDGATRMRSLVSDLLDYSRVETQGKTLKATDAGNACAVAMQNLEGSIEECGAKVDIGSLPIILADSAQLVRLFQNLIGNAIKYRGERTPEIKVEAQEKEQQWLITIKDNGIGMEPQYFERIFVMFQRLHARKEYTGTGIGLAICKRIIERMGGRIWVESEVGEGSTFNISVPVITESTEEGMVGNECDTILVKTH